MIRPTVDACKRGRPTERVVRYTLSDIVDGIEDDLNKKGSRKKERRRVRKKREDQSYIHRIRDMKQEQDQSVTILASSGST